jgi:hypothetical protein
LSTSLIALLASGAMTASAGATNKVLVLKEEGTPVAVGAELEIELSFDRLQPGTHVEACTLVWRGHMSLNGAHEDKASLEPVEHECEALVRGSVSEVALVGKHDGRKGSEVTISGSLREVPGFGEGSPTCTYEGTTLSGKLAIPGPVHLGVAGKAALVKSEGRKCRKAVRMEFVTRLRGPNGKLLEAELLSQGAAQPPLVSPILSPNSPSRPRSCWPDRAALRAAPGCSRRMDRRGARPRSPRRLARPAR